MIAVYNKAVEALLGVLEFVAQKNPATGENLQQVLLDVEIAIDRASTEQAPADNIAQLLNLRQQLLTAKKIAYYAQPSQY